MDIKINGYYRQFKGNKYKVLAIARESDTLEELVVYQGQYNSEEFGPKPIWVRPKAEFCGIKNINGQDVSRFKHLEE